MEIINSYFRNIVLFKVDSREEHAIYAAFLSGSLQDGSKQYVLAFVPAHLAIKNQSTLGDLHWVNIQTRAMKNSYRIQPQRWEISRELDNPMFTAIERTETKTKYVSDKLNLEMVLIHDPKKKSKLQYHTHMNLVAALKTFRCVISLIDGSSPAFPASHHAITPVDVGVTPVEDLNYQEPTYSFAPSIGSSGDGKYNTIGLTEYTIPNVVPQRSNRKTQPRGMPVPNLRPTDQPPLLRHTPDLGTTPFRPHIDDSFEFL